MVRRAINAITAKIGGLEKAAFWLAFFSALSLILGFLRDRILTHYFGAGPQLDVYYAAFETPDILFATVASLASASILVPVFSNKKKEEHEHPHALQEFVNSSFTSFSILLFVSCGLAFVYMPVLVKMFFGGFSPDKLASVATFSRVLLLSPLFLGLSNFFGGIVQFERRFLLYALSPLFYNAGIIASLLLGVSHFGVFSAVYGVAIGAFLHVTVQGVFVFTSPESPKFTKKIFSADVKKAFLLSVPRTISLSASGLVGFFFVSLASKLSQGSIAVYTLGFNLQSVLLSLIGASYSLAAFPTLAMHYAKNETEHLVQCLGRGLRHIIFWATPTSLLFIVLRAHIVRTVLGTGAFSWSDTRMTAAVLGTFVVSIVFQSAQLFITRAHYAFGKTKLPLIMNITGAVSTAILAIIFFQSQAVADSVIVPIAKILKVSDLPRLPVLALPFAFSVGSAISAFLLFFSLPKTVKGGVSSDLIHTIGDTLISSAVMVFVIAMALRFFNDYLVLNTAINVFMHGLFSGLCGILAWFATLKVLKNRELEEVTSKSK